MDALAVARILLVSTTTGYQTREFGASADRLGVDLALATDRCHVLDDPWRDAAVAVRFHDEQRSLEAVLESARARPIDGVVAVGDRPAVLGALVAQALGLRAHPPAAARRAANKLTTRETFRDAGLPVPWFAPVRLGTAARDLPKRVSFPCVVKPLALSGSQGVIRANDAGELDAAIRRVERLLAEKTLKARRDPADAWLMVEGYVEGPEVAVEAVVEEGRLQVLALFDKPDPLDGPFFEETIYVTPSSLRAERQQAVIEAVAGGVSALGLRHGPVHAECRLNDRGVHVLEIAPRPIGGLCSRALRFVRQGERCSLEELLLRQALGESLADVHREGSASGVMMIPIPREGYLRGVRHVEGARAVEGIEDVRITARPDQRLRPLPEGATYLGFIFARAERPAQVVAALREAHGRLEFDLEAVLPVV